MKSLLLLILWIIVSGIITATITSSNAAVIIMQKSAETCELLTALWDFDLVFSRLHHHFHPVCQVTTHSVDHLVEHTDLAGWVRRGWGGETGGEGDTRTASAPEIPLVIVEIEHLGGPHRNWIRWFEAVHPERRREHEKNMRWHILSPLTGETSANIRKCLMICHSCSGGTCWFLVVCHCWFMVPQLFLAVHGT